MLLREVNGRIAGKGGEFFHNDDTFWVDRKEREIRFPEQSKLASKVERWFMTKEELASKYGK